MGLGRIGQALSAKEVFDHIRDDLAAVEQQIALESVAPVDTITSIGRHLQASGGKRLRPSLLLLACRTAGTVTPSAIRLAAVVEMIHTATLVHDDVIDAAETRRGRPSTNAQWGNHTSVLAGDWLYMQAFQVALRERNFRVLDVLIALTQGMVEGELIQLKRIGQIDLSEADYMELVDRKTAGLFAACARLGAVIGEAGPSTEEKLAEYGWNLGMAFQLVDDVLDFTAREKTLGKPVGNDLREGKVTLPLIYALAQSTSEERVRIETILADCNYERVPFSDVLKMVRRYQGIERAMERAQTFTAKAREALTGLPESPGLRALFAIPDFVTARDR